MLNARPLEGRIVLRLGVQEVTRRGMGQTEMWRLADFMARVSAGEACHKVADHLARLAGSFPSVAYGFDDADAMEVAR